MSILLAIVSAIGAKGLAWLGLGLGTIGTVFLIRRDGKQAQQAADVAQALQDTRKADTVAARVAAMSDDQVKAALLAEDGRPS